MKILLSCYTCKRDSGSESQTGFEILETYLKLNYKVFLITQEKHHQLILRDLPKKLHKKLEFIVLPQSNILIKSFFKRIGFRNYTNYLYFQILVNNLIKKSKFINFDVAHHVTYGNIWFPIGIRKTEKPIILGPIGGMGRIPINLWKYLGVVGIIEEIAHRILSTIGFYFYGKSILKKAFAVFAANYEDMAKFQSYNQNVICRPHPILHGQAAPYLEKFSESNFKLIFVGRLIPWKGIALLLNSLRFLDPRWNLSIIGKGPDIYRLQRIVEKFGLSSRVTFEGYLPKELVLEKMKQARIVINPSFRDSSGWVVAEALSVGKPVLGFNLNGVGTVLKIGGLKGLDYQTNPAENMQKAIEDILTVGSIDQFHYQKLRTELKLIFRKLDIPQEKSSNFENF